MKKLLLFLALILTLPDLARAQQKWTLSAAAATCTTSNTSCLIYLVDAVSGGATFTVSANSGNTIQFEATGDGGTTWVALNATPSNSTTAATSTTSTGTWQANVAGYTAVRMRMSTLSSGTATVSIITSLASARAGGGGGGGGGTVTSVSGTANQIDVATGTTTPVISLDSAIQLPGTLSASANGALTNAPFLFTGSPVTGGTGTSTVPMFYFNGGTAPTNWPTTGTYFGINAVSGFGGDMFDVRLNGGSSLTHIDATGNVFASSAFIAGAGLTGIFSSQANSISFLNSSQTTLNYATFGPNNTSWPALCPTTSAATPAFMKMGTAGGACATLGFIKTGQALIVSGADVTCGTGGTLAPCTSFTTITGLTVSFPLVAANWSFDCKLIMSQATAAAANQIGIQTATNGATNLAADGVAYTAAATPTAAAFTGVAATTTAQSIVTFTPAATGTKLPVYVHGTIEGVSTSGTVFNLQVLTGAAGDLLTIYRGSSCWIE